MADTTNQKSNNQDTILLNENLMKQTTKPKESKDQQAEVQNKNPEKMLKDLKLDKATVLADFRLANLSRFLSITGRREVLTGKAKFGIFGDGKEIIQIALAKQFREGDWRSGYYRDQTWMMAMGLYDSLEFFHQLYGNTTTDVMHGSGGRVFNNHFSTQNVNPDGSWRDLTKQKNSSSDVSPTASQMPRLLGLAYASKLFRGNPELHQFTNLSRKGNEVAFGSIGDASTSEGHFWETMNAAGVLQVPLAVSVYDDGYGISVPKKYQTTKGSISEIMKGFQAEKDKPGIFIYKGKGWDYPGLIKLYEEGIAQCREKQVPVLFHIEEVTQPQGHSTSGSHERYKGEERLNWETEFDPIKKMREWIVESAIATDEELDKLVTEADEETKEARRKGWEMFQEPIRVERDALVKIINDRTCRCAEEWKEKSVDEFTEELKKVLSPIRKDNFVTARKILRNICKSCIKSDNLREALEGWLVRNYEDAARSYNSFLYNETPTSVLKVKPIPPVYSENSQEVPGRQILKDNYDKLFAKYPLLTIFGEDVGHIGGVNQTLEGLQKKYGEMRITDTGIREATILGQGIGLALRGMRPIAEIQYLDYLMYALQLLSDDLATTYYRTAGRMMAPLIVSTRGHRLEGIWHSGSPVSMLINSVRGVYVCSPRDMTRAAGFYNTLLAGNDPAIVIEPLNGYRLKEKLPDNIGEFRLPLGIPEILHEGTDITIVTYGSTVKVAIEAVKQLEAHGISVELIDVQTLVPFDLPKVIVNSIRKTNKILFLDEDVPGGTTAYMMQQVLEKEGGWQHLDIAPKTLTSKDHRPAYTTDGDYFSKPNAEDIFDLIYEMMREVNPKKFFSMTDSRIARLS
ncbi:MAG TPA: thiamine pyrophosphate-dependent enzyme [Bacteroidales bacterium]|jgi:pyruvate/2-oxoglutarate/acetoin dehydrogenase E1 component/TPP-dependent pyruvate/acetoin dehydrogenase alpha subunit|nr:thiamine pyrophosphate-dependent enzyme [Bacteroidales bacterium]